jgi:16S rRNA U516 pseudouridylate synthase RsuA-like enzyme
MLIYASNGPLEALLVDNNQRVHAKYRAGLHKIMAHETTWQLRRGKAFPRDAQIEKPFKKRKGPEKSVSVNAMHQHTKNGQ